MYFLDRDNDEIKMIIAHEAHTSSMLTLLGTCTYSNYNKSYARDYEDKDNVMGRIT